MPRPTVCVVEVSKHDTKPPRVIDFRPRCEITYGEVYANALDVAEGRTILVLQDADDSLIFGRGTSIHINKDSFFLGQELRNLAIEKPNVRVLVSERADQNDPASPSSF